MGLSNRLKERREQLGLTQSEVATLLGITPGAVGNYENGVSTPKADVLFKVFDALKCDANYLFQDEMSKRSQEDNATPLEMEHLVKKYRGLDTHGKEMVDFTLEKEYERSVAEKKKSDNVVSMTVQESSDYQVNAAHAIEDASDEDKAYDEDIMDDENF
jgi:transcriptional regulator with XRE-family HTH domain